MSKIITGLFIIISFTACSQNQDGYKNLDSKSFSDKMNASNTVIIDVRTPEEYYSGHIPKAKNINIYDPDFSKQLDGLDKEKTYLVYCQSGSRSAKAANQLHQKGFKEIYNLDKGFSSWHGQVEK